MKTLPVLKCEVTVAPQGSLMQGLVQVVLARRMLEK